MLSPATRYHVVCTLLVGLFLGWILSPSAMAKGIEAPAPLADWQGWVSYDHDNADCPHIYNGQKRQCFWPATLKLDIRKTAARFTTDIERFSDGWVSLPGSLKHWPQNVKTGKKTKQLAVVNHGGTPVVWLRKGQHQVSGTFNWSVIPKSLHIPDETGILHLSLGGKKIQHPDRTKKGLIHLHDQQTTRKAETEDRLEIQVFRKISDSIPMLITTRIDLRVAGTPREISLGAVIPPEQIPVSLHSKLPVRLDATKQIRTQIRPGHFVITLTTRINELTTKLSLPDSTAPWPTEEIWCFEAQNSFRTVTIKDGISIDPSQTSLPKKWHGLPTYLMKQSAPLVIETRKRGNEDPAPDNLSLNRTIWLDEDGSHYTIKDEISGTMHSSYRLEMQEPGQLGRVSMNGSDQLITRREQSRQAGIEVRHGAIKLLAISRIQATDLDSTGWAHDFQQVQATLNLPPGWRLFATTGIDQAGSWLRKWTLLDLFLVLLIVLSISKLFDLPTAGVTLVTLALIYHEPNAPRWIWPNLLITLGLIRVIPIGKLSTLITLYLRISLGVLLLISIPFMVEQAHWSLHPQLGHHNDYSRPSFQDEYTQTDGITEINAEIMSIPVKVKKSSRKRGPSSISSPRQYYQQDPAANVQTGPGLPNWHWQTMRLSWNGPVLAGQPLNLILVSPTLNRILGFGRVLFLALLILLFLRKHLKLPVLDLDTGKTTAILLFLALLTLPPSAQASGDFPPQNILKEYETRLFSPPDCLPECAAIDSMAIRVTKGNLHLSLAVHSYADTYIPLPASGLWEAETIHLDGQPATLRRDNQGILWLYTQSGIHTINMNGPLPGSRDISFSMPLVPHLLNFTGDDWQIDGLDPNKRPGQNIQLRKTVSQKHTTLASFEPGNLPAQLVVERILRFDLEWSMGTTVRRISPTGSPVIVQIPLLDFESVTTGASIKDKKIQVTIPAGKRTFSWTSSLNKQPTLSLRAQDGSRWTEMWKLDISPMWHVETRGIPATHTPGASRQPSWNPWPGETLEIQITKPAAIEGETFTIEASLLKIEPGQRSTESTLTLQARSSKGGQHALTLPDQSTLKSVQINGRVEPIRMQGQQVMVPIRPGQQNIVLNWTHPNTISTLYTVSPLSLGQDSVNGKVEITVPRSRWVLFTGGPQMGPAILFWAEFLVILLLSLGLGKIPFTPLRPWQWMLLAGGLSQAGLLPTAMVVLWLLALGARREYGRNLKGGLFNLQQCGLVLLTLIAALSLFYAVHNGLLGRPQMQIDGNGSSSFLLKWYQDRFVDFPQPWFISAPLLVFRLSMLAWALWLAFSVLGWLRWGWECFATDNLWRKVKRKATGSTR